MTPVRVRIVSAAREKGCWSEPSEQQAHGMLTEKHGKYYVIYDEAPGTGLEGTRTTLKWDAERVILLRSGTLSHRQEFCRGLTDRSLYRTPYLELPLETETRFLRTGFVNGCWRIELEYTLRQDGALYGDMRILIDIEEEADLGH